LFCAKPEGCWENAHSNETEQKKKAPDGQGGENVEEGVEARDFGNYPKRRGEARGPGDGQGQPRGRCPSPATPGQGVGPRCCRRGGDGCSQGIRRAVISALLPCPLPLRGVLVFRGFCHAAFSTGETFGFTGPKFHLFKYL